MSRTARVAAAAATALLLVSVPAHAGPTIGVICDPHLPPELCGGIALVMEDGFAAPFNNGLPPGHMPAVVEHVYACGRNVGVGANAPRLGTAICSCSYPSACAPSLCDSLPTNRAERYCGDPCHADSLLSGPIDGNGMVPLYICYYAPAFPVPSIFVHVTADGVDLPYTTTPSPADENCWFLPDSPVPLKMKKLDVGPLPAGLYDVQLTLEGASCSLMEHNPRQKGGETEDWQLQVGGSAPADTHTDTYPWE